MRTHRPLLTAAVVVLGSAMLIQSALAFRSQRSDYEWFDPLVDVRGLLRDNFVENVDDDRMRDAALSAMVESLEDPYTVYVPPTDEDDFNKAMKGSYVGIGAEIDVVDGWLTIVSPLDDSPALEAGVRAGDTVLSIEDESTFGLGAARCAERLMGEAGTPVRIRVRHADGEEEDLVVVRSPIRTRTVKGFRRDGEDWRFVLDPEDRIAYVRLTQFTEETAADLREALASIEPAPAGVVLDLRFNGGGTLQAAIEIADLFLRDGTIVSVRSRRGVERAWSADDDGEEDLDAPMIVLVNDASASASEIVSGALQENGRAKVLGQRTYGKGSVQEVRELPGRGGILKMTTAHYALPSGRNLNRGPEAEMWGVDPDPGFHVPMDADAYRALVDQRRGYEAIGGAPEADGESWSEPAWLRESLGDAQLAAALESLDHRLSSGEWLVVGDDSQPAIVAGDELRDQLAYRRRLLQELASLDARIDRLEERAAPEPMLSRTDLDGGELRVLDAEGQVIGTFRITDGAALEPVLRTAPLEPAGGS
ncbi:MAG: S41 family peptidase [Phycisphaerales bacterium]